MNSFRMMRYYQLDMILHYLIRFYHVDYWHDFFLSNLFLANFSNCKLAFYMWNKKNSMYKNIISIYHIPNHNENIIQNQNKQLNMKFMS